MTNNDGAATSSSTTTTEEEEEHNAILLAMKVREQCKYWQKTYRSHTRYGRSCPCGDAMATGEYLIGCDPVRSGALYFFLCEFAFTLCPDRVTTTRK